MYSRKETMSNEEIFNEMTILDEQDNLIAEYRLEELDAEMENRIIDEEEIKNESY